MKECGVLGYFVQVGSYTRRDASPWPRTHCRAGHEITCVSPHPALREAAAKDSAVRLCVAELPIEAGKARVLFVWNALKEPTYILHRAFGGDTIDSLRSTFRVQSYQIVPSSRFRNLIKIAHATLKTPLGENPTRTDSTGWGRTTAPNMRDNQGREGDSIRDARLKAGVVSQH